MVSATEGQFYLAKMTATTRKFHHALITDDVVKYKDPKQAVIRHFKAKSHELIERALSGMELEDKRPLQLVNEVKRRFAEIG